MKRQTKLFSLLVVALATYASWAAAANVVFYVGASGQTLYVRIQNPAGAYVATALSEGTSGADGNYYASEATIAALTGMSSASTGDGCAFTVRVGTASTTAVDPIAASGYLPWSGSAEVSQLYAIKSKTDQLPSDPADASDIATAFSGLSTTLSSMVATLGGINTTLGTPAGASLAADIAAIESGNTIDPTFVDDDHTWSFDTRDQITSPVEITESASPVVLVQMDFSEPMPKLATIQSITSVTIADVVGATEPTIISSAVDGNRKTVKTQLNTSAATAATYTLTVKVLTVDGQTFTRKGRLTIQ